MYVCRQSFFLITKLGTHDLHASTHKTGTNVRNFDLKIFLANFLNFQFRLSLWSGSSEAL